MKIEFCWRWSQIAFSLQPVTDQVYQQRWRLKSIMTICCMVWPQSLWSYFILVIKVVIILFHPSEFMFYFAATWSVFTISIVFFSLLLLFTHTCAPPNLIHTHTLTKAHSTAHAKMKGRLYFQLCAMQEVLFPYTRPDSVGVDGALTACTNTHSILILMYQHLFMGLEPVLPRQFNTPVLQIIHF